VCYHTKNNDSGYKLKQRSKNMLMRRTVKPLSASFVHNSFQNNGYSIGLTFAVPGIADKRAYSVSYYASDEHYKTLPRLSFSERYPLIKRGLTPMLKSILSPLVTTILNFTSNKRYCEFYSDHFEGNNLEKAKIATMVRDTVTQTNSAKIDRVSLETARLDHGIAYCFGPSWDPCIGLFPGFFYTKETLPNELSLDKLQDNRMTEDEWVRAYEIWLLNKHVDKIEPSDSWIAKKSHSLTMKKLYKSQLTVDARRLFYRSMLTYYQSPEVYDDVRRFIIGHELSHLYHNDTMKPSFFLAAQLLSIAALQSSALACIVPFFILQQYVSRSQEKRCDRWSANMNTSTGGIRLFEDLNEHSKLLLNKYPELQYSMWKSSILELASTHPGHLERAQLLKKN